MSTNPTNIPAQKGTRMPQTSCDFSDIDHDELDGHFYHPVPELTLLVNKNPSEPEPPRKTGKKRAIKDIHPSIETYYSRLSKFPPFTRKEELIIFNKYNSLKAKLDSQKKKSAKLTAEVKALKDEIIHRNLRFVVKVASGFWLDGKIENLENLISSGNVGLIRAVDRFKPAMGTRFLTYAAHWIALEIRTELSESALVRIPTWWQRTVRDITKAYDKLSEGNSGVRVDVKKISKESGVGIKHIGILSKEAKTLASTDLPKRNPYSEFCEFENTNAFPTEADKVSESICIHSNASKILGEAIKKLNPKEKLVIEQIYGLTGEDPKNLRQVSNVLGNTSERVRQLKVKSVGILKRKLRAPSEYGGLGIDNIQDII